MEESHGDDGETWRERERKEVSDRMKYSGRSTATEVGVERNGTIDSNVIPSEREGMASHPSVSPGDFLLSSPPSLSTVTANGPRERSFSLTAQPPSPVVKASRDPRISTRGCQIREDNLKEDFSLELLELWDCTTLTPPLRR